MRQLTLPRVGTISTPPSPVFTGWADRGRGRRRTRPGPVQRLALREACYGGVRVHRQGKLDGGRVALRADIGAANAVKSSRRRKPWTIPCCSTTLRTLRDRSEVHRRRRAVSCGVPAWRGQHLDEERLRPVRGNIGPVGLHRTARATFAQEGRPRSLEGVCRAQSSNPIPPWRRLEVPSGAFIDDDRARVVAVEQVVDASIGPHRP